MPCANPNVTCVNHTLTCVQPTIEVQENHRIKEGFKTKGLCIKTGR